MPEVAQYWDSFILTFRYLNAEFDYDKLSQYLNKGLVFFYYCFYLFAVSYVLINMFIAVILEIYAEQKAALDKKK